MNVNQLIETTTLSDDTRNLLYQCIVAINSNDPSKLESSITDIPINKLSAVDSSKLLNMFLDICRDVRNSFNTHQVVKIILKEFNMRTRSELEEISMYSSLFYDPYISVDNLQYLSSLLLTYTFMSVAMDITNIGDWGDDTLFACMRLDQVYPNQTLDTYKVLVEAAFNLTNDTVYAYFMNNVSDESEYAPIPEWVTNESINFKDEVITNPTTADIKNIIQEKMQDLNLINSNIKPSERMKERLISLILDQINDNSFYSVELSLDEIKNRLSEYYDLLPQERYEEEIKDKFIQLTLYNLNDDELLFRFLGPANPSPNPNTEQLEYGGYRMFKSGQWDFNEDNERISWFTGSCDGCGKRIRKKWHSIRMPVLQGGWKGCFCSFPCMKGYIQREIECLRNGPDLILRRMVDHVEKNIKEIGIQERI